MEKPDPSFRIPEIRASIASFESKRQSLKLFFCNVILKYELSELSSPLLPNTASLTKDYQTILTLYPLFVPRRFRKPTMKKGGGTLLLEKLIEKQRPPAPSRNKFQVKTAGRSPCKTSSPEEYLVERRWTTLNKGEAG